MKIALTGAQGFLGWHTRVLAHSLGHSVEPIRLGPGFDEAAARSALEGADLLVHLAGVNRGTDDEVHEGNRVAARQISAALASVDSPPPRVAFSNSVQAGNGSVYGGAKEAAGEILAEQARAIGAAYTNAHLPNIFGEHGRPRYNSVVATFSDLVAQGLAPEIHQDKELGFLHAQRAAEVLLGELPVDRMADHVRTMSVSGVAEKLQELAKVYQDGTVPDIVDAFDRDLFNTYRSFLVGDMLPIRLTRHADSRGSFFEVVRSRGGEGQSSFSTTVSGITRGQHYHRRKIERFTVLSGSAEIAMRRMFDDKVYTYTVDGDHPVSIDMPTMWTHKITNTGSDALYTMFWINEIYDPASPDTIPEEV
ncbi:capsular biosynthesis protein [Sinomonas sp. G460-2]|uniref:polysaccharide biosynthesis C-terminal domain-containing protein n=1 Tax=Sinomonas sp. G460-2 TaxID=3393464 RepID=UPI0039EFFE23